MNCHRDVGYHLVIDELVLFGEHHIAVEGEEASEFLGIENVDALEFAVSAVQLMIDLYRKLNIGSMSLREP